MKNITKTIYENFSLLENQLLISNNDCELIAIDYDEMNKSKNYIKNHLKSILDKGKCSEFLIYQLSLHQNNYGEKFGKKIEFYSTNNILMMIENLEKDIVYGKPFSGKLKEYMHIHHSPFATKGNSIIINIKNYWFKNKKIKKQYEEIFQTIVLKYEYNIEFIGLEMMRIAKNEKELTGEWLIYKIKNNVKYYLCLAAHNESNNRKETDEYILNEKLAKSLLEFPELIN